MPKARGERETKFCSVIRFKNTNNFCYGVRKVGTNKVIQGKALS